MITSLSINVNKIALLRNARGGNIPSLTEACLFIQQKGADGITVHPRPDERHIRYQDARDIKKIISIEFNIEGNPKEKKFIDLVLEVLPAQVTLVPDAAHQLTSDHGWDIAKEKVFLKETIRIFKEKNIRVSLFVDPDARMVDEAREVGADRIELYTESYARIYPSDPEGAIAPYMEAATRAFNLGLEMNAGHDLNCQNLAFFKKNIPYIKEVSIGQAFVADALYVGFEEAIRRYQSALGK